MTRPTLQPRPARASLRRGPAARWIAITVALSALVMVSAGPSIGFGYVQDGLHVAERNAVVERGDLGEIVRSHYWAGTSLRDRSLYRPTTVASFALERGLTADGQASPAVSHVVNLAVHVVAALLLAVWVDRIGGGRLGAFAAAALFAAHPVMQQSVVNVAGRADLLAAALSLAALVTLSAADGWAGGAAPPLARRRALAWTAGGLMLLALGAKEVALAIVPVAFAQEWWFRTPRDVRARAWWLARTGVLAPVIVATLAYLMLRTLALEAFPGLQRVGWIDNVLVDLDGIPRVATTFAFAGRYLGLLVYPARLSGDYSGKAIAAETGLNAPWPLLGLALAVVVLVLVTMPIRANRTSAAAGSHGRCAFALAAALFAAPYLLIGNVLVLHRAGFAERLLYVPALGLCALFGLGYAALVARLAQRSGTRALVAAHTVLVIAVVAAAVHARGQNRFWRDDESLLVRSLEVQPQAVRSRFTLAGARMDQGRIDEALELYEQVLARHPRHSWSWTYSAVLYARKGEADRAEHAIRRAVELVPNDSENQTWLGSILVARGRLDEAERAFRRALMLAPANVSAGRGLAEALFRGGRYAEAARWFAWCRERGVAGVDERLREAERRVRGADRG